MSDAGLPELVDGFKRAMALLAGPVTIITAGSAGEARGLTASAVCSVSIAPPTLLICVNRNGDAQAAIAASGAFCVNILAEANREVADRFAGRHPGIVGQAKFEGAAWSLLATGSPALDGAIANVDCRVAERVESHTHTVFFGTVMQLRFGEAQPPLVHFDRAYRSLT